MSSDPLVELTSYDTGDKVYIRPSACTSIHGPPTRSYDGTNLYPAKPQVLGKHTRIDIGTDHLLVTESAETVRALFMKAERPDVVSWPCKIFEARDGSFWASTAERDSHDKLTESPASMLRYRVRFMDGFTIMVDANCPEDARVEAYRITGGRFIIDRIECTNLD